MARKYEILFVVGDMFIIVYFNIADLPGMEAFHSTAENPKGVAVGLRKGTVSTPGPFGSYHLLLALNVFCNLNLDEETVGKGEFSCTLMQAVICCYKVFRFMHACIQDNANQHLICRSRRG